MDEYQFSHKLDEFIERLGTVIQKIPSDSDSHLDELQQNRIELAALIEELHISLEELRAQNDELKTTRSLVEAQSRRYQELFEFAPDGYLETDAAGNIREANQAAARMFGVKQKFLTGKSLPLYIYLDDRSEFRRLLSELQLRQRLPYGETQQWEFRIGPRNNKPFYALIIVGLALPENPIHVGPDSKEPLTLRWMIHDITELKQAQEALRSANLELEERVEERTQELVQTYRELQEFTFQLEQRNADLQDFAFIASHDLQEPLRKIKAFAEQLEAHDLDPTATDYVERMHSASIRMQKMLESLLEYARINSRGQPFENTDLNQIAQDVISNLELRIRQTNARIEVNSLPKIKADPLQIYSLFQNLVVNALKFHRENAAPEVIISAEKNSKWVKLHFKDNGIGFDPIYQDRLFKPFSRLQGRSQFEGSGMGLANCRKIAERHGGEITAESTPGEGATFIVSLPCDGCET